MRPGESKKYKHAKESAKNILAREIIVLAVIVVLAAVNILFLFPVVSESVFTISGDSNLKDIEGYGNSFEIFPENAIDAEPGDYLVFNIKAVNDSSTDFPKGTVSLQWRLKGDYLYYEKNTEKFEIFVDSLPHEYHVRAGENINYGPNEKITSFLVKLPSVDGIKIEVESIEFRKRVLLPVDSHLNRFLKYRLDIPYNTHLNRFFIPSYLVFVSVALMILSLKIISKKTAALKALFFIFLCAMLVFSFYYMKNNFFTFKSYFSSYRSSIKAADFRNTYKGFYDFEKFIDWLDIKIPEEENIILLLRGEQIYIMSEMAYNLYPRDIKFVNISLKDSTEVKNEIEKILREKGDSYSNIVALAKEDIEPQDSYDLIHSYKPQAGLIYEFRKLSD